MNTDSEKLSNRELDTLVAEKVTGWKRVHSDRDEGDDRKDVAWMNHYQSGVLKGEPYTHASMQGFWDRTFSKWSPSTDISAAMEVVGALFAKDYGWNICSEGHGWTVEAFPLPDTGYDGVKIQDEALPKAICLAALAAITKDEK